MVTRLAPGEFSHRWPQVLPDGKAVLFATQTAGSSSFEEAQIAVHSLVTGERKVLVEGGTHPRFVQSGHLVWAYSGQLFAAPFDPSRLETTGPSVPLVDRVMSHPEGAAQFSISANGSLVVVPGGVQQRSSTLAWVNRQGEEEELPLEPNSYGSPTLSPGGRRLAVTIGFGQDKNIHIYDLQSGTLGQLTFRRAINPVWTPDGKRVTFSSLVPRAPDSAEGAVYDYDINLFSQPADGSGTAVRLLSRPGVQFPTSYSPNGRLLAFADGDFTARHLDGWMLTVGADMGARPFLGDVPDEIQLMFSPDGNWIVYVSNESGVDQVYVRPYPGPGSKRQISTRGGTEPRWAANMSELFYREADRMMAVEVLATAQSFETGRPTALFEGLYEMGDVRSGYPYYDVTPDGQRFLMIKKDRQTDRQTGLAAGATSRRSQLVRRAETARPQQLVQAEPRTGAGNERPLENPARFSLYGEKSWWRGQDVLARPKPLIPCRWRRLATFGL